MQAIYGAQLAYFPELFEDFPVFSMAPKTGGGYGSRTNGAVVHAVFQRAPGGALGIEADLRQEGGKGRIWVPEEDAHKVGQGRYLADGNDIYIFDSDNTFLREGGFIQFGLSLVTGPTDQQKVNPIVDLGKSDYA